MTLESEVFTGLSAGARVDACQRQELRLTDHARPHGSDLAFDLSIIASLDGSRSQPPVPAAENPAIRDAAALLEADRTFNVQPTTMPPPATTTSGGCSTPDPFVGLPSLIGMCVNGGWIPVVRSPGS